MYIIILADCNPVSAIIHAHMCCGPFRCSGAHCKASDVQIQLRPSGPNGWSLI